jgi:hypothetical protein
VAPADGSRRRSRLKCVLGGLSAGSETRGDPARGVREERVPAPIVTKVAYFLQIDPAPAVEAVFPGPLARSEGADGHGAMEPPIVTEFPTEKLGDGLKVMSYFRDKGTGTASLSYAWRSEELETAMRLFTACPDLGRLQGALDDLDDLARPSWWSRAPRDGTAPGSGRLRDVPASVIVAGGNWSVGSRFLAENLIHAAHAAR